MFNVIFRTGELCYSDTDIELSGFLPCTFSRTYRSLTGSDSPLGFGWHWPWDIQVHLNGPEYIRDVGRGLALEHFPLASLDDPVITSESGMVLLPQPGRIVVVRRDGLIEHYAEPRSPGVPAPLELIQDSCGNSVRIVRQGDRILKILDSEGREYRISYGMNARISGVDLLRGGIEDLPARLVTYDYDLGGDLVRVVDRMGYVKEYSYSDHLLVTFRNRVGGMYHAAYDEQRRCIAKWQGDGGMLMQFRFDDRRKRVLVTYGDGYSTEFRLRDEGEVTEEIDFDGSHTTYAYGPDGSLLASSKDSGPITSVTIDATKERSRLQLVDAANRCHQIVTKPETRQREIIDAAGSVWTEQLDARGLMMWRRTPLGTVFHYEYDARGEVIAINQPNNNRVAYRYSENYRHLEISDNYGNRGTASWDEEWRLLAKQKPGCSEERYYYDALGRVIAVKRPNGSLFRFELNAEGYYTSFIDELGARTLVEWSPYGDPLWIRDANGNQTRWEYDVLRRNVAIQNAAGQRMAINYDPHGRPVRHVFFDGSSEEYGYDSLDNLNLISYSDGTRIHLTHDATGRLTGVRGQGQEVTFEYDARGYLVSSRRDGVALEFQYDAEGRRILEKQGGVLIQRSFDTVGNCTGLAIEGLGERQVRYDGRRRVVEVRDFNGSTLRFEYDLADRCRRVLESGGSTLEHDFSSQNRPLSSILRQGSSEFTLKYTWDEAGRISSRALTGFALESFGYDPGGRLSWARQGDKLRRFDYSPTGDPLRDALDRPIEYSEGGRLQKAGNRRFRTDGRGRITGWSEAGRTCQLDYDSMGDLVLANGSDGAVIEYQYDGIGRRLSKRTPFETTRYIWDGDYILAESNPKATTIFFSFDWRVVAMAKRDGATHGLILSDFAGFPLVRGPVTRTPDDPWGYVAEPDSYVARFAGQIHDSETGLYYNHFRYFDPSTKRFITPDPIGIRGGLNPYIYTSDPLNVVDPNGLTSVAAHDCPNGSPTAKKDPPKTLPRDLNCSRGTSIHNDCINMARTRAAPSGTRADQTMETGSGANRPDLKIEMPGRNVYIEWDNAPASRAAGHKNDICNNDPGALVICVTLTQRYQPKGTIPAGPAGSKAASVTEDDCGIPDINKELTARGLAAI
jgi:RHS repeat-associated protein